MCDVHGHGPEHTRILRVVPDSTTCTLYNYMMRVVVSHSAVCVS